jgi:hypothetical protein
MTASWKYVRRLIGVVLGLIGLISWLALQTPAMQLASASSYVTSGSFAFACGSYDRRAIDRTGPSSGSRVIKPCGNIPLVFEANQGQTGSRVKFISRDGGYRFYLASAEAVLELRIAHLGLRNAGLRSAVDSPSQSQSATISKTGSDAKLWRHAT